MRTPETDLDQRDWILVDRRSGFITRGLTREEVSWIVDAPPTLIEACIADRLIYQTISTIVVGEWRKK